MSDNLRIQKQKAIKAKNSKQHSEEIAFAKLACEIIVDNL